MFKCYICGKEYETPIEAANCTIKCDEKEKARKKELLTTLKDTITRQYTALENNIRKYNNLNPDEPINIKLSIGDDKAVPNSDDVEANKSDETTTSNEDTFTNYNFYEDTLNNFIKMLNKYL